MFLYFPRISLLSHGRPLDRIFYLRLTCIQVLAKSIKGVIESVELRA